MKPLMKKHTINTDWLKSSTDDLVFIVDQQGVLTESYEPKWMKDVCFLSGKCRTKIFDQVDFPLDARKKLSTAMKKVKGNKKMEKFEYELQLNDENIWLEIRISSLLIHNNFSGNIIIIIRNITEQKIRERQLKQHLENLEKTKKDIEDEKNKSQTLAKDFEKFKLAVDNASDHIIMTDTDSRIIYVNKAVETITGYTKEESIGKNPSELWGGEMDKKFYKDIWNTIKNKKKTFIGEMKNKRRNGEIYIVATQIFPILNDEKKIIFYVGIERDITNLKEIDKMKSEFVSVVSHQLRTPLTGIKWYTQFLMQNDAGPLTKDQKEYVEQIYNSNERMIKLVNDLLNIARIETGIKFSFAKEKTNIIKILKETVDEQNILAQNKKIKIICDPALNKKIMLMVDREKMRQVFQNLINNAIKYSFLNKKITVGFRKEKENFIFFVEDEGLGITKDQQGRIFEKFFRADNILAVDTDGTGLGLYIAKAIVEGHGGKIYFKSKENEGTTFYVSIPLNQEEIKINR